MDNYHTFYHAIHAYTYKLTRKIPLTWNSLLKLD